MDLEALILQFSEMDSFLSNRSLIVLEVVLLLLQFSVLLTKHFSWLVKLTYR